MTLKKSKKLLEITNTPKAKKFAAEEPEACFVTKDEDILDLRLDLSDGIFEDAQVDMSELKFKNK